MDLFVEDLIRVLDDFDCYVGIMFVEVWYLCCIGGWINCWVI